MSIANELTRLQNAKTALATSIANKGVTVPAATKLDGYAALVDSIQTGGGGGGEGWQRPSDWPDYSKIPLANVGANEVYITYDCRNAIAGGEPAGVSFRVTASDGYTVERGSIGGSGFVAAATSSLASNALFQEILPTNEGNYVVYRVTASNNITDFRLMDWSSYIGNQALVRNFQPVLEYYGKLEYITGTDLRNNTCVSFAVVLKSMTSMLSLFYQWASLENVDTTGWDTSNVTSMQYMFLNCYSLRYFDASNLNMANVSTILGMFQGCQVLRELDVSGWDTSKVTTIQNAFMGCKSLRYLDVSNWDTSRVTNMSQVFNGAEVLGNLDVSGWDFSACTNNSSMFNQAKCQTEVRFNNTLSRVDTYMFYLDNLITTYIFESTTPPTLANANAFNGINSTARIYVPDAAVNDYKAATNWSTYASYIYPLSDYTP